MERSRIRKFGLLTKLIVTTTILMICSISVLNFFIINHEKMVIRTDLQERGLALANNLAYNSEYGVLTANVTELSRLIVGLLKQPDVGYCIIRGQNGNILASSGGLPKGIEKGRGIKQLNTAIRFLHVSQRGSQRDYYDIKVPVMSKVKNTNVNEDVFFQDQSAGHEIKIGLIQVGISCDRIDILINKVKQTILTIVLVMLAITVMIIIFLGRMLLNPLKDLMAATQKVASGDLNFKVSVKTQDELEDLAKSFNQMILELKQTTTSVDNLNKEIIERNKTQAQLKKAYDELTAMHSQLVQSEKMASIGQLAAGVAHEINNPLGFIINNMEVLQQYIDYYTKITHMMEDLQKKVEEENIEKTRSIVKEFAQFGQEIDLNYIINDTRTLLEHTQRGLERVHKIVIDLRTFAREGSDAMEATKVETIIDSILDIVQNELKYKAELRKNYGDTPLIQCSPQKLGQVFINLLVNAAQAIEEKGVIEIKTYTQNGHVCVDVRDTGRGINADDLKKVFDPFFTTKPIGQGTGLGLSVSYEIIMKHNGEIRVQSQVGQGTTFTVMLPIA